jgi:hypothetical protein
MTDTEKAQLRYEIERFGFVVPLVVRPLPREKGGVFYQIIDGEHRWLEGMYLGMSDFPCYVVDVDTDTAMQLTPILNELHGTPAEQRLGELLKDLLQRQDEQELRLAMPFSRERFDELIGERTVDWAAIQTAPEPHGVGTSRQKAERWVERVYRMPIDAAAVVDQAVAKAREGTDGSADWQGLELIAADFLGR